MITDDSIREIHGLNAHCPDARNAAEVSLDERETLVVIRLSDSRQAKLTTWQARYLARKLYRLARRIDARTNQEN